MAQQWDIHCNKNGYGLTTGAVDNLEEVEFKSGRRISYLRNSVTKHRHDLKFKFDDSQQDPSKIIDGRTEYQWFEYWMEVTLKGLTESFYFTDIISHKDEKEYKIEAWPTTTGQKWKYVNITFIEV